MPAGGSPSALTHGESINEQNRGAVEPPRPRLPIQRRRPVNERTIGDCVGAPGVSSQPERGRALCQRGDRQARGRRRFRFRKHLGGRFPASLFRKVRVERRRQVGGRRNGRRTSKNRCLPHRRRECLRRAALHPSQDSGRPAAERAPFWEESEAVEPIVLVDNAALHFAMLPVDAERFHPRAIGGGTKKGKVRTVGARSVCGPFS